MRGAATVAIVTARLRSESRITLLAACACALLAYLQRYDDAAARTAGCLVFSTLTGIVVSLLQRGAGRCRELELCEQSAPLYGRELARATALVPCVIATAAQAAYWAVALFYARADGAAIALCAYASYAATLVAMSATVRTGASRLVYVVLACAVSATAFALMQWPALPPLLCAACGFVALRQYGEALARYDPVTPWAPAPPPPVSPEPLY